MDLSNFLNLSKINSPRLAAVPLRNSCFDTSQLAAGSFIISAQGYGPSLDLRI